MKELRFRLLRLLKDYAMVEAGVPFCLIAKAFPTKSYKNVSMQLAHLKSKGFVDAKGSYGRYLYFVTPKGILYLSLLEAKKRRSQAILEADIDVELELYNSYS